MPADQIEGVAKQGVGRVEDAVGGLTGDDKTQAKGKLNEAAGSLQQTYGQVKDKAQETLGQVTGKAQETIGAAKDKATETFGAAKEQAQTAYGEFEGYVNERPMMGVVIGVGFGLLLGMAMSGGKKTVYYRK